ncbi:hypothetical protein [Acaricomes phytoseiuli]|uniref:hypothetical protein n=1 Tax=Acaricomes phytoseiuli TaxID=291968 RepID=UPI00036CE69A|nr:hypothetical protein [Acaricomes phytoseiuli]
MKSLPLSVKYILVVVAALALIAVFSGLSQAVGEGAAGTVLRVLMFGTVGASGLAVMLIKQRHSKVSRADAQDSFESAVAAGAGSAVFRDSLVVLAALGLVFMVFTGTTGVAGLLVFAALGLLVADFFVRYWVGLRRRGE